jgi:hypothetical protein
VAGLDETPVFVTWRVITYVVVPRFLEACGCRGGWGVAAAAFCL